VPDGFVIVRDARGSLVHVRHGQNGECVGCIEVGRYEVVRALVIAEQARAAGEGSSAAHSPLAFGKHGGEVR
jgi:hypothetical protein